MNLPNENNLPVNLLSASFNNTSATYKFYWFLSILQSVELGQKSILKKDLFARMISNAWYTVNYFRISFGKQDKLQRAIESIREIELLNISDNKDTIYNRLLDSKNVKTHKLLFYFNQQVPHWFLSPWFPNTKKSEIYSLSTKFERNCLYALYDDNILINPFWEDYIVNNLRILKNFCYWNLVVFLQSRNPNVPDLPNKLIKPGMRSSLGKQRVKFWDIILNELGSVDCIYTGKMLTIGNYAVEHFIPHNFVSHNLIWNLIPADKSFNSRKSNKLPPIEKYFKPFYNLQHQAFEIIKSKTPKNKYLEEYYTILPKISTTGEFREENFREIIQPLISIASNNGFEFLA